VLPAAILWGHALAALLFAGVALAQVRAPRRLGGALPRHAFVAALVLTALWALAVAGIDGRDVSIRLAEAMRDAAWLVFMMALVGRGQRAGYGLAAIYCVVMLLVGAGACLAVLEAAVRGRDELAALVGTRLLLRMMVALSALVLVHQLALAAAGAAQNGLRLVVAGLGVLWGIDLVLSAVAYLGGGGGGLAGLVAARGPIMAGVALLLGIAADRRGEWRIAISRTAALRSLGAVALAVYAGGIAVVTRLIEAGGGEHARLAEAGVVVGATTTLLTLVANPWLRAWARVKVAKHLFRHRYDYRAAWHRFSETLGQPGERAAPLAVRVVMAMAELTDSPAGLLLVAAGDDLDVAASWRWHGAASQGGSEATGSLIGHLAATGRIVELDAVRAGTAPTAEALAVPGWMIDAADAWALIPLPHGGQLAGAILLARPCVDRRLDWEDYDLLRVAGRQAASCLAEDRAHRALADAARFDEFNRRFAFIMHDIKNLVSQLSLVARNAERHADNPEFRTDMVATLKDSSGRLQALLARLSQHSGERAEPIVPVDVAAVLARIAAARRDAAVRCAATAEPMALAQPGRLETVLGHLVQNALEASPAPASVALSASVDGDRVVIAVADRGDGMSAAFVRDQLFRPFASTKNGGFGLGAFEARQLVEAMGGRVEVTSREGEGTCFRLLLPRALAPALEEAA
jgi:putative PEP-CTERM system histidine kinase